MWDFKGRYTGWLLCGHPCLAGKCIGGCRTARGRSSPAARPVPPSRFRLQHPHVPHTSGSARSVMQSPSHIPMHGPVMLCMHQSKAAARCWLRDPVSPTLTHPGTRGQLQVSITWRKQPASSVCITCWRRKTTESARGQKQQPGEEEFIKRKGKGSKAYLCKGRASGKPSCDLQPQRVRAGAMPTQPSPLQPSPQLSCPSERHSGTLLPPPSRARGLRQRVLTKLNAFTHTYPGSDICCCLWGAWAAAAPRVGGCFFRAQGPAGGGGGYTPAPRGSPA